MLDQAVAQTRMAMCISDPHLPDSPLVFVNQSFMRMTGYSEEEILGRNCRFLQGPKTDPASVEQMRELIRSKVTGEVSVINYRKSGEAYISRVHIGPIFDEAGELRYYFGSQLDMTEIERMRSESDQKRLVAQELNHRMRNMFAMIGSIVSLSGRGATDPQTVVDKSRARINAMAKSHELTANLEESGRPILLNDMLDEVLGPHQNQDVSITRKGNPVALPPELVTPLGLTLYELTTNSVKYGALGQASGDFHLHWSVEGEDPEVLVLNWTETGDSIKAETSGSGVGSRIIEGMLASVGGTIDINAERGKYSARLQIPLAQ